MAALIKRRRIEIQAFERERVVARPASMVCPVCHEQSEFLTPRQAAALVQVKPPSIRRWLRQGKAHGLRTVGGGYRICRRSLFLPLPHSNPEGVAHEPLQLTFSN